MTFLRARSKGITSEDASTQPAREGLPKGLAPRLICTGPHSLTLRSINASTCELGRTKLVTKKKSLHDSASVSEMQLGAFGKVLNTASLPLFADSHGFPRFPHCGSPPIKCAQPHEDPICCIHVGSESSVGGQVQERPNCSIHVGGESSVRVVQN